MMEYETVVLDRNEVPKFSSGMWPTWVTHSCGLEFLQFWSSNKPHFNRQGWWESGSSLRACHAVEKFPALHDMLCELPESQRIARIEYRLKPEPYSEDEPTPDPVNNPPHYTQGEIECIDAIRSALTPEELRGHCKGNAMEYIWREKHKNGDEDIRKAIRNLEAILEDKP